METKEITGGWVIMDETARPGHAGPRFYLVASDTSDEALALITAKFGVSLKLTTRGPAPKAHLTRRNMKPGDVFVI